MGHPCGLLFASGRRCHEHWTPCSAALFPLLALPPFSISLKDTSLRPGMYACQPSCTRIAAPSPFKAVYRIEGLDYPAMNALRVALTCDVVNASICTVKWCKYSGDLTFHETLGLQAQLVPIRCDNIDGRTHALALQVEAPLTALQPTYITSASLRPMASAGGETGAEADLPQVEAVHFRSPEERAACPADDGFKLGALRAGQCIDAVCTVGAGIGREGVQWIAVAPAIRPLDDHPFAPAGFDVTIETTGAIDPDVALVRAITAVADRLAYHAACARFITTHGPGLSDDDVL